LDTAADITVIPARIAEELQLIPLDEVPIGKFDGRVSWVSTFLVQLALRQATPKVIRVVASRDEPYVLLGRDVLNDYRATLDGPLLRLEIE
jgi:predicted aspartyl protease